MGQKRPRLSKKLIRKYFGKTAKVSSRWFADGYRVTTESGGEVLISNTEMKILSGGDDVYRALTLLGYEMWGKLTVRGGTKESMITWAAHGEALGVNVRPGIKRGWFGRAVVLFFGFAGILNLVKGQPGGLELIFICAVIWWLMARSAKKKDRQLAAQIGFAFPRVHGMAGAASDDDLERENWV